MNCRNVRNRFDELYRQGGGDPDNAAWAHISSCASCGKEYRRWKEIADTLKKTPHIDLPEGFVQRVMIAYEERQRRAAWFNPMPLRLPQIAWAMLFLVMLGGVVLLVQRSDRRWPETAIAQDANKTIQFEIAATGASSVALVADFNGWDKEKNLLTRTKNNVWSIEIKLPVGSYQYLFLVDGKTWRLDPLNNEIAPDGFGGMNSEITL